jgi:DmsE family decaheme c-type cytochrome
LLAASRIVMLVCVANDDFYERALRAAGGFAALILVTTGALAPVEFARAQALDPALTGTLCAACHRDEFAALENNPHAALNDGATLACVECHGGVEAHIAAGGAAGTVFAFRDEAPGEQASRCLNCHAATHPDFQSSPHAAVGMACGGCHLQHGAELAAPGLLHAVQLPQERAAIGAQSAVCFDCHAEVFAQFSFNERHRLEEGSLECASCHDPHAAQSRFRLGGFKQEQCTDCHTDKRGPFVFEHAASRVEGCTSCHAPHGAPNRHLLTHQRVAETCYACHAGVPQFHVGFAPVGAPRFGLDTQCTNCHSTIHGSNFDPAFLR